MVRSMVDRLDNPSNSLIHICKSDRPVSKNSSESSSTKSSSNGTKQIIVQHQRHRSGTRVLSITSRHVNNIQTTLNQYHVHVQQPSSGFLFHGIHALLDFHAKVHRNAVQTVGVLFVADYWHCGPRF